MNAVERAIREMAPKVLKRLPPEKGGKHSVSFATGAHADPEVEALRNRRVDAAFKALVRAFNLPEKVASLADDPARAAAMLLDQDSPIPNANLPREVRYLCRYATATCAAQRASYTIAMANVMIPRVVAAKGPQPNAIESVMNELEATVRQAAVSVDPSFGRAIVADGPTFDPGAYEFDIPEPAAPPAAETSETTEIRRKKSREPL